MSLVVGGYLGAENREPTPDEVMKLYVACREAMTPKWVDGVQIGSVPLLQMVNTDTFEIQVNNPSIVLQIALAGNAIAPGWRGAQYPDADLIAPREMPRDYRLTYTLLNYRRASLDGHWVLGDRSGMNILYNPDENLDINWWSRSPKWRGLRIWHL